MKKLVYLLFLIPVSTPIILKAQNETSIIAPIAEARDCEYIGYFTGFDEKYQDIDSSLRSKFRPAFSAPSGTTAVTVGGATARAWYEVIYRLRREAAALSGNNNPFTRLDAAVRATGNTWLINALNTDATDWDAAGYTNNRSAGRKRLKRE